MEPYTVALLFLVIMTLLFRTTDYLFQRKDKAIGPAPLNYEKRWEADSYIDLIHDTRELEFLAFGERLTECHCRYHKAGRPYGTLNSDTITANTIKVDRQVGYDENGTYEIYSDQSSKPMLSVGGGPTYTIFTNKGIRQVNRQQLREIQARVVTNDRKRIQKQASPVRHNVKYYDPSRMCDFTIDENGKVTYYP